MKRISTFGKIFSYNHILTCILHWTSHFQKLNHTLIFDLKKKTGEKMQRIQPFERSNFRQRLKLARTSYRWYFVAVFFIGTHSTEPPILKLIHPLFRMFQNHEVKREEKLRIFQEKVFSSLWLWNCLHDSYSVIIWCCVQVSVS